MGHIKVDPYYHTEHNLFPVGYKSVRSYYSMKYPGIKCDYICEILEGHDRPMFKVTNTEDIDNPIIKSDPTECWNYIYEIAGLLNNKTIEKLAISGTERFGLLDSSVIKFIE